MKNAFVRAVLLTASLLAFACSAAPAEPDPALGSAQQALMADSGWDPEPDPGLPDAAPPDAAPPPPPVTTCTNATNDGVCRRYCCTTTSSSKRCGVLPCPTTIGGGLVFTTGTLLAK